jgi:metallophosphoesterase superfamily enzyme
MSVDTAGDAPVDGLVDGTPTLARLARPTARTPTRLAVLADTHLTPTESGGWKALHRSEQRLRAALSAVSDTDADGLLLLGDLTSRGHADEFAVLDELLSDVSVPRVAVPGNHDVPAAGDGTAEAAGGDRTPRAGRFADRYGDGSYPCRVDVGDVSILCLDSASDAVDTDGEGAVSAATVEWLSETLPEVRSPLVAMHHNLFSTARHTHTRSGGRRVANAASLARVLRTGGAPLVLSGHLHWPSTTVRDGVREVVAPSTCSFPPAVLLLDVTPWGTTVRVRSIAGRRGLCEAYDLARRGNRHSRRLAARADAGYFETLPVVNERPGTSHVVDDVPASLRWR